MDANPEELPELWSPPVVEHVTPVSATEERYLLAWGDDAEGARWGFLLWPPRARGRQECARWVRWEDIRPVTGEDYSTVPLADPLM
ncbi:hypothetical protein [Nonomuraea jiangxiensis]|nr:hypothetical protein [Nonomuraea jiangxiensis]